MREHESKRDSSALLAPGDTRLPCGDATRMGRLLARLEPRLVAVARRILRDPSAAPDVVQNAFEKVLRRCEQFRGGSRVSTWMHRIVVNEALMWMRREGRRQPERIGPADHELLHAAPEDPEAWLNRREDRARVSRALSALPPDERSVLTESLFAERSYAELGRAHGTTAGAMKSRAFRARRRMAELLREPRPETAG